MEFTGCVVNGTFDLEHIQVQQKLASSDLRYHQDSFQKKRTETEPQYSQEQNHLQDQNKFL